MVALKHRSDRNTWHHIFVQEYKSKISNEKFPNGKTLYLVNIPPYITEEHIKFGYKSAGTIERIIFTSSTDPDSNEHQYCADETKSNCFSEKPHWYDCFKSAYVIFKTYKAVRKAIDKTEIHLFENNKTILDTGLNKWMKEYLDNHVNEKDLEKDVEGYLELFDETEKITKEIEQKQVESANDDGEWTIVGKKGKHGGFPQSERILSRLNAKIEENVQKKQLNNFYKFQKQQNSKKMQFGKVRKNFATNRKR